MSDESSSSIPVPPSRWYERWWGVLALVALAVTLANGWMGALEFQLDDFEQISDAARRDGAIALLGEDSGLKTDQRSRPNFVAFFRPALHLSFVVDYELFGGDPQAFHLVSVAWHGLATFLLYLVLVAVLTGPTRRRIALATTLVYAVHPGKWGAISWIAARGDILSTVFGLAAALALVRFRERGRPLPLALVFAFVGAALASKEGAIVIPAVLAVLDALHLRRSGRGVTFRRSLLVGVPLALCAVGYLVFRRLMFGEYADYYAARHQAFTFEVARRMVADVVPSFVSMLSGWFYYEPGGLWQRLAELYATLAAGAGVLWLTRRPVRRAKAVLLALLLYLLLAMPILRFWREAIGYEVTRVFYLLQIFPCLLLGLPLSGLFARGRLTRLVALVILATTLGILAPAVHRHLDAQFGAARILERIRSDLGAIAAANRTPGVAYGVLGIPDHYERSPIYGSFLLFAMSDVFVADPVDAVAIEDKNSFLEGPRLRELPRPVQILQWTPYEAGDPTRGRLQPYRGTGVLPAPTGRRPALEIPAGATTVDLGAGLVPRDVDALRIVFREAPTTALTFRLEFEDEYGETVALPFDLDPAAYGMGANYLAPVKDREDWIFRGRLLRLRIDAPAGDPGIVRIDTDATLPAFALAPATRDVSLAGPEPDYAFFAPEGFAWFRVVIYLGYQRRMWTLSRGEFATRDDGALVFHASQPGRIRQPPELREDPFPWDLVTGGGDRPSILDVQGWESVRVRWHVEALTGQIDPAKVVYPQARSESGEYTFKRK
ncbi:MAG: glycosyltransferase family 39 protein [Planctomycetota bacterium]